VKTDDTPTNEPNVQQVTYRRRLFVAFFVSFLWLALGSVGLLNWIPLPSDAQFLFEVFIPVLACIAFFYPTALFRQRNSFFRIIMLILVGVAIVACALALLAVCAIARFAFRAASGT
jgi:hypothetical protein